MAPIASTRAEWNAHDVQVGLEGLLDLYESERTMYQEILELSRRQSEAIRQGKPLGDIRTLLDRKRTMLDMIAHMENQHQQARRNWAESRHRIQGEMVARMQRVLASVGDLLEEILRIEAENDRLFLTLAEQG
jgi:hypothetical protein